MTERVGGAIHAERMSRFLNAGIYLVTSAVLSRGRDTISIVEQALSAGIRLVQLREKEMAASDLAGLARDARTLTAKYGALLIINDRLDVALAAGADGVHLGRDDLPVEDARRIAPDLIIGASSHTREEALDAQGRGASYVNIGPIYPTGSKQWAGEFLGPDRMKDIASHLEIPFTVMGGIKRERIPDLVTAGARTLAVITAITAADDPEQASKELLEATGKG